MRQEDIEVWVEADRGQGGQSVGSFAFGIWAEHIPTGLKAFCDAHNSQHRNRSTAVSMLEWGLADIGWKDQPIEEG